jgi:hypothetical protein
MSWHGPLGFDRSNNRIDIGTRELTKHHPPGPTRTGDIPRELTGRLRVALVQAIKKLPPELRSEGELLLSPQAISAMAGMIALSIGSQFTPVGWVVDAGLFCLGVAALGRSSIQAGFYLGSFARETYNAERESDLLHAGDDLAKALVQLGVGSFLLWLTKRSPYPASLTTPEAAAAARAVKLDPAGRDIAFWSGVRQEHIPRNFATLERMLDETPAGRALQDHMERLKWEDMKGLIYELSDRTSQLAESNKGQLHYFVDAERGYIDSMFPSKQAVSEWWPRYQQDAIKETRLRFAKEGPAKVDAEVKAQQQRWSRWTAEDKEAQFYAMSRRSKFKRPDEGRAIEDEVFHKIEKLRHGGYWIHEINKNGVELRRRWYQP